MDIAGLDVNYYLTFGDFKLCLISCQTVVFGSISTVNVVIKT